MKKTLIAGLLVLCATSTSAQNTQMSPEQIDQLMQSQMQMMVPMFGHMMKIMMNTR